MTLLDSAGHALPVVGNPAVVPVHIGSYSEILTIPLKWENWCGTGAVTVRASLGTPPSKIQSQRRRSVAPPLGSHGSRRARLSGRCPWNRYASHHGRANSPNQIARMITWRRACVAVVGVAVAGLGAVVLVAALAGGGSSGPKVTVPVSSATALSAAPATPFTAPVQQSSPARRAEARCTPMRRLRRLPIRR